MTERATRPLARALAGLALALTACSSPDSDTGATATSDVPASSGPISDVAVDSAGNVYTTELAAGSSFDCQTLSAKMPGRIMVRRSGSTDPEFVAELQVPMGVTVDSGGTVYAIDGQIDGAFRIVPGREPEVAATMDDTEIVATPDGLNIAADGNLYLHESFGSVHVTAPGTDRFERLPYDVDAITTGTDGRMYMIGDGLVKPAAGEGESTLLVGLSGAPLDFVVDGSDIYVLECLRDDATGEPIGSRIMLFPNGSRAGTELPVAGLERAVRMTLHANTLYIADGARILTHPLR